MLRSQGQTLAVRACVRVSHRFCSLFRSFSCNHERTRTTQRRSATYSFIAHPPVVGRFSLPCRRPCPYLGSAVFLVARSQSITLSRCNPRGLCRLYLSFARRDIVVPFRRKRCGFICRDAAKFKRKNLHPVFLQPPTTGNNTHTGGQWGTLWWVVLRVENVR